MAKDAAIIAIERDRKPYPSFQMVPFSMTLSDLFTVIYFFDRE